MRQTGKEFLAKSIGLNKQELREFKLEELKQIFNDARVSTLLFCCCCFVVVVLLFLL